MELENSLCVFPTLASLLKKDFATEPELFWRVKVNPTQGQAATSAPFPHPALPFSKPSTANSWALQGCEEPGLRTLQSKSLCLCLPLLCTSLGFVLGLSRAEHHKLSEAFFSDSDERLNEVSSGSGEVWLKSISSSSGGKSESRAYKGKTDLMSGIYTIRCGFCVSSDLNKVWENYLSFLIRTWACEEIIWVFRS